LTDLLTFNVGYFH